MFSGYLVALGGRDDPRRAAKGYNAGPANPNPTAGEGYATRVVELIAHYHTLAGAGGPGTPLVAVVRDGYALPFDPAGLHAVTTDARPPRDPEWQLVRPHHSGRVAVDIALRVGTPLYALVGGEIVWAGESGNCGYGLALQRHVPDPAVGVGGARRAVDPRVAARERVPAFALSEPGAVSDASRWPCRPTARTVGGG